MHDVGVVLAGENVSGSAHVGGELVNLVEAAVDCSAGRLTLSQIALDEIIGLRLAEARILEVDASHPDDTLRSAEEVERITGLTTLGIIPKDLPKRKR